MVETVPGPTVPPLVIIFHILNDATLTLATRTKEMAISTAFSLKIHKSARFPLQMIHDILITKVPAVQSYHPYIRCSFQLVSSQGCGPFAHQSPRHKSAVRNTCCSLPRVPNSQFLWVLFAWRRLQGTRQLPMAVTGPPATSRTTCFFISVGPRIVSSSFALAPMAVFGVWSPCRQTAGWHLWMEFFGLHQREKRGKERRHKLWFPNLFLLIHNFGNATCQFHWGKTRKMTGTECAYSQWPSIT